MGNKGQMMEKRHFTIYSIGRHREGKKTVFKKKQSGKENRNIKSLENYVF